MKSSHKLSEFKLFLDEKVDRFNQPSFIESDPISIPHAYGKKQDIEIAGLFAAVLAWGQRVTIIKKCKELLAYMDDDPHQFVLNHSPSDLKPIVAFKHRTFNTVDTLYFVHFLRWYYTHHQTLEDAFKVSPGDGTIEQGLINFYKIFCSLEAFSGR